MTPGYYSDDPNVDHLVAGLVRFFDVNPFARVPHEDKTIASVISALPLPARWLRRLHRYDSHHGALNAYHSRRRARLKRVLAETRDNRLQNRHRPQRRPADDARWRHPGRRQPASG